MEAECLPDNIDREAAAVLIDKEVRNIPSIESQTLSLNYSESGAQQMEFARRVFFFARFAPLLAWSLALLLVALLFALVPGEKRKIRTQGVLWGLSGISIALAAIIMKLKFNDLYSWFNSKMRGEIPPELTGFIKDAAFVVYNDVASRILIFAVAYLVLGTAFFLLVRHKKGAPLFKYIKYGFLALTILGVAGVAFTLINAEERGVFEPVNMENIQMRDEFNSEDGNEPYEARDSEVFPDPPTFDQGEYDYKNHEPYEAGDPEALPDPSTFDQGEYDYKNPPRSNEDNDPNAVMEPN